MLNLKMTMWLLYKTLRFQAWRAKREIKLRQKHDANSFHELRKKQNVDGGAKVRVIGEVARLLADSQCPMDPRWTSSNEVAN